jgi:hypothetical protein
MVENCSSYAQASMSVSSSLAFVDSFSHEETKQTYKTNNAVKDLRENLISASPYKTQINYSHQIP